jgi:DNA-binding XRE family transcriptional regulator
MRMSVITGAREMRSFRITHSVITASVALESRISPHLGFVQAKNVKSALGFQEKLGQKVRALRSTAGLSQEGFAEACGLHRTHISMLERGLLDLKISTMRKVAEVLKVSLSELLDGL